MWTAPKQHDAGLCPLVPYETDGLLGRVKLTYLVVELESAAIMFQEVTTAGLVAMMITLVIGSCALGACCAEMQDRRVKRD